MKQNSYKSNNETLEKINRFIGFFVCNSWEKTCSFIKEILKRKNYNGILPEFFTIDEYLKIIADKQEIKGIEALLIAYQTYSEIYNDEDLSGFLKWFPTVQKDWDDMKKFHLGMTKKF